MNQPVNPIRLAEQRQAAAAERRRYAEKHNGAVLITELAETLVNATTALRDRKYVDFRPATWNDEEYAIFDAFYIDDDNGRICGLPLIAVANERADIMWVLDASRVYARHAFVGGTIADFGTITEYVENWDKSTFFTRESIAFLTGLQRRVDLGPTGELYPFDRFTFTEAREIMNELDTRRSHKLMY